jgi:ketosteroid isomerase-like protein
MSEENVEVMRSAARLFEAADWDGFGALFTQDAGLWALDGWPEPGPFFGRTAIVQEFQRLRESWGANRVVIEDHSERGDRLLVRLRWIVEGAISGVPAEMTLFVAARFEDGQIADYRVYANHPEALEAAGLSE